LTTGRFVAGLVLGGFLLAAAGCQSGDSNGGGTGMFGLGGGNQQPQAQEGKVLASELRAYCPRVIVKEDTGFINQYAKGGEGDPSKLLYQASISESTRSCNRTTGMLAMNVAVAGRVVPGPAGVPAAVTLPVKVSVVRGDGEVQYSQVHTVQVAIAGGQAQQFLYNDANVVVPIPADNTLQVFAGFDVKPSKKQAEEELF
jgi:hypothetical protein